MAAVALGSSQCIDSNRSDAVHGCYVYTNEVCGANRE